MLPIPYGTTRPQRRYPWMNIAIIVANVVVYFITHLTGHHAAGYAAFASISNDWYPYMLNPPRPWGIHLYQFITYQFLHQDISHIGFNMLFLWVFGNNLNDKLGHFSYLAFYLAGGVLAGCGQVFTSNSPTLGASGAISAVTGLFLVLLPNIDIKLWFFDVYLIPSVYFILFKVGQDIYEQYEGGQAVAYMAHISGTAAGFLIGMFLLMTKLVQRDHYDLLAMLNRFRRRHEYRSIVAKGYDPFLPTTAEETVVSVNVPSRPSLRDPRIESLRAEIGRLLRLHDSRDAAKRYVELKAIDSAQVLPAQEQVDVASQLMSDGNHAQSAVAYEDYLRVYPGGGAAGESGVGQQDQITLMLALIYARYLPNPARARELFLKLLPRLHHPAERELAAAELKRLSEATPKAPL
ncbi:MAG TPA: rhomboid family intramembrane serine protease [Phycisphaerae bacterium]|jgi:membrane associated rhomboid family serine protease